MSASICSLQVKAEVGCYLRFGRQHPLVAFEAISEDILAVTKARRILIVEVKVSIADLRADARKDWHRGIRFALASPEQRESCSQHGFNSYYGGMILHGRTPWASAWAPNEFWFAVPEEIQARAQEVMEAEYPYAGLLVCEAPKPGFLRSYAGRETRVALKPKTLHDRKASQNFVARMVKCQSASLANAYTHVALRIARGEPAVVSP